MFTNYLAGFFIPTSSRILDGFVAVGIFLFGLCVGSFLNCVIYRLEKGETLKGRSFCPCCKHLLSWQDLFPVLSFAFLKSRCRYCKEKISWQYPLVEIITAIVFVLVASLSFGKNATTSRVFDVINILFLFYVVSSLIIIFIYDLKHYLIPDKILFPAIIATIIYNLINYQHILSSLFAVLASSGFFLLIFLFSKGRAMGFGDVKLAVLMGLLLGFYGVLAALFLAFFFGAIIGTILMVFGKRSAGWRMKSEIPFGPFLIAGTFVALLWGSQVINWYLRWF